MRKGRKSVSVEFRVFGKKRIERKVPGKKKNQSDLGWKFLLSSCSLVGLYVVKHWLKLKGKFAIVGMEEKK